MEEVGRGLLDVVARLGRVVRRELGEEPRPEAPGSRPERARVRDHEPVRVRQQTSAASLEALEPRLLAAEDLAALNEALPRATEAVTREVSRRLTAGAAETREVEEESLCICCLDRPRDIVFLSCNHMVVCEQCAPRMASCPTCRMPITEKRRIFR